MSEQNPSKESTRQTLGQVKVDICRRQGNSDCKDLADYLVIPPHDQPA
jgi:hypothetical protein